MSRVDPKAPAALHLGGLRLSSPFLLAPMAGYTIPPLRALCRRLGASLSFTEMVSAAGLVRSDRGTRPLLERAAGEEPAGVQLFGSRPAEMAAAARVAVADGFDLVDLNLGCPVPKVCRTGSGAALLRDEARVLELCQAVVAAVSAPVTVKLRLGWDEGDRSVAERLIPRLAAVGVAGVTVHGRTRAQGYGGRADWEAIRRCRESAAGAIPVLGSGDLFTATRCIEVLAQGLCDAVQLARGALANPWLFQEARELSQGRIAVPAPGEEIQGLCRELLAWLATRHGQRGGVMAFRSFFCRLVRSRPGAARLREEVYGATTLEELEALLERAFPAGRAGLTPPPAP